METEIDTDDRDNLLRQAMKNRDILLAYAHAILRDWALAEDSFQEMLVVVTRKWETYDSQRDLLKWLRGIIRFEALKVVRSRSRETLVETERMMDVMETQFDRHGDDWAASRMERMSEAMRKCLDELDEAGKSLVLEYYTTPTSYRELAATAGRTENALRLAVHRIRSRVKVCVKRRMRGAV